MIGLQTYISVIKEFKKWTNNTASISIGFINLNRKPFSAVQ